MPRYTLTVTLETSEPRSEEELRAAVEQAMKEQWGWVGLEGDPRVSVTVGG